MAEKYAETPLTTLNHHLDLLWLHEAYRQVKKDSSPGVDGVTVEAYGRNLSANLADLLERAKSGRYHAPLVKRVHIPKNTTETRPIGMPTVENKVLERAVVMLLEPVYEREFLPCSYGFRRGRSAIGACQALRKVVMSMEGGYVLDVDVRQYFDTIPHGQLRTILRKRIGDGVIDRLIGKWLKAGIWEAGLVTYPEAGSPQGGVISPMLSNIYLHEVLDYWFEHEIKPGLEGRAELIRFADDFVVVCEKREDAENLLGLVRERFTRYGLEIHPDKTRIAAFRNPRKGGGKPETFDFLGFTHYWGRTRNGGYAMKSRTSSKKYRASLQRLNQWCKLNRHRPVKEQHQVLCQKVQGHYAYYGIRGNFESLQRYRQKARRLWHHWLLRRSRERHNKKRLWELIDIHLPLPRARIVHTWNSPQMELNIS